MVVPWPSSGESRGTSTFWVRLGRQAERTRSLKLDSFLDSRRRTITASIRP